MLLPLHCVLPGCREQQGRRVRHPLRCIRLDRIQLLRRYDAGVSILNVWWGANPDYLSLILSCHCHRSNYNIASQHARWGKTWPQAAWYGMGEYNIFIFIGASSIFHRAEKLTWMTSFKKLWLSSSQHALHAFCNLCTCYTCRVVNECKVFGNEGAVGSAPGAVEMERKWRDVSRPKLVSLLCSNEFVERRKEEIWIDSLFVNDWCEENQICT